MKIMDQFLDPLDSVTFIYARAADYSIGDGPGRKWLSKGISEIRSVLGYPGEFAPSRKLHLVILAGFEFDRALRLIEEYEPSRISVGYADPSESDAAAHLETNVGHVRRIREIVGKVHEFGFPGYNPQGTIDVLTRIVSEAGEFNTVLAPMNTKLSTIGASIFALRDQSVQLCYAQAATYNFAAYSRPGNEYYILDVPGYPSGKG
jgi:hypothetical protein